VHLVTTLDSGVKPTRVLLKIFHLVKFKQYKFPKISLNSDTDVPVCECRPIRSTEVI